MSSFFKSLSGSSEFKNLYMLLDQIFDFRKDEKTALGISGGSDSMFAAFLLVNYREERKMNFNNLYFLHCNHKIRKESDSEEIFLHQFFRDYHFVCFQRNREKKGNEETLRKWRYQKFFKYCNENGIKNLVLGHNLTDRIETTFMNMIRGCGINGFLNMNYYSEHPLLENIHVIRPLLDIPKDTIEAYCKKYCIPYFNDKTNFDTSTSLRNKLRHDFIFPLSEVGEGKNMFFDSWKTVYQGFFKIANKNQYLIPIAVNPYWNAGKAYERYVTQNMISERTISHIFFLLGIPLKRSEIINIKGWLNKGNDGYRNLGKWFIFISHGHYYYIQSTHNFWEKELQLYKPITGKGPLKFGKYTVDIPQGLEGAILRFPKKGDHYKGKLLTKWAINKKIPIFRRNILPLAEKDGKVIYVFEPDCLIF